MVYHVEQKVVPARMRERFTHFTIEGCLIRFYHNELNELIEPPIYWEVRELDRFGIKKGSVTDFDCIWIEIESLCAFDYSLFVQDRKAFMGAR